MLISNSLCRRGFFKILAGAVIAGTFISSPAVADAIEQFPEDKISIVARKARNIVEQRKTFCKNHTDIVYSRNVIENDLIDLFNYMNVNFDHTVCNKQDLNLVFTGHNIDPKLIDYGNFDEERLRLFLEGTIPVAVIRSLMWQGIRIPYQKDSDIEVPKIDKEWRIFVSRYKNLIMDQIYLIPFNIA